MLTEPGAREYVDVADLASVRLSIRGRAELFGRTGAMRRSSSRPGPPSSAASRRCARCAAAWWARGPCHRRSRRACYPRSPKASRSRRAVIFCAFLFVFRSPSARLMTMIPSFFAILSVFIVMRAGGHPAEHRHHPDRLDGAGRDRERPGAFLLPLPGRHVRRARPPARCDTRCWSRAGRSCSRR